MTKRKPAARHTLSFEVCSIIERHDAGYIYYETILREYCSNAEIVIRGKYWKVGTKLDWSLFQTQEWNGPLVRLKP